MIETSKKSLRNFILLLQGQFVSMFGNQLYDIAMLLWIKEMTGSATIMGLAMIFTSLPEALLSPFGGAIGDRYNRVRVIMLSDLFSGLVMGIALWAAIAPLPVEVKLGAFMLTNLLLGLSAACFAPTVSALVPTLVSDRHLLRANAAHEFSSTGAKVLGQAIGSLIFTAFGAATAFLLNMVSFFVSGMSESFIRTGDIERTSAIPLSFRSILSETYATFKKSWKVKSIRWLIMYIGVFHLFFASMMILLPFLVGQMLDVSDSYIGLFMGVYSLGVMMGFAFIGSIAHWLPNRNVNIAIAATGCGLAFLVCGCSHSIWITSAVLLCIGICIGVIVVNLITQLQESVPEEERARLLGIAQAIGGSSYPIGMGLFGLLFDWLCYYMSAQTALWMIFTGCGGMSILLGCVYLSLHIDQTLLHHTDSK